MHLLAMLLSSFIADVDIVDYYGPHPLPETLERAMCWIEGPHVHSYAPADRLLYVEDHDQLVFVGDPTEYERASPAAVYYGHHPVTWTTTYAGTPEHYCYISGPHHHWHAPPPATVWVEKGGAWWYVGKHPSWYEGRRRQHTFVDAHYEREAVIVRPTVVVAPPSGWVGVSFGRRGVSASVGFGAPVIVHEVHQRPVVIVEEHHHHDKHHHHPPGHAWGHKKHKGKRH